MLWLPARLAGGRRRQQRKDVFSRMTGAMYAAIGGLKTHMNNLNVIGNNVANVNTAGYKTQRQIFQETIYTTYRSGSNGTASRGGVTPSQIGFGAQVGAIDLIMSPSTFNPTGADLDCMIEGDGFLMVGDKDAVINGAEDYGKLMLTRVGDLCQDPNGYICDSKGNVVYGFATVVNPYYRSDLKEGTPDYIKAEAEANAAGFTIKDKYAVSSQLVPLRVPTAAAEPTEKNGGIIDGKNQWERGDPVYDILGGVTGDDTSRTNINLADGKYFNDDGGIDVDKLPDGAGSKDGTSDKTYAGPVPNLEGKYVNLRSMSINENGAIVGTGDSGTVVLGYVAIANVDSPSGVTHMGGPYYQALEGAGDITVSAVGGIMSGRYLNNQVPKDDKVPPMDDALGNGKGTSIRNGGLEASSTDVATEFANMIVTQRGYQANTRIITVTDSMLEELVNMKR